MKLIFLISIFLMLLNPIFTQGYEVRILEPQNRYNIDKNKPFIEFQVTGDDVWNAENIGFDIKRIDPDGNSSFKKITERIWVPFNPDNFQDFGNDSFLLKKTDMEFGEDAYVELTIIYPEKKLMYLCDNEGEVESTLPKAFRKLADLRKKGQDVEAYSGDKMIVKKNGQFYLVYAILYHSKMIRIHFKDKKIPETSGSSGSGVIRSKSRNKPNCKLPGTGSSGSAGSAGNSGSGPKDSDGDGIPDDSDLFPNDISEWGDSDKDGIGDNKDKDDDNDGTPDKLDYKPLDSSEQKDSDGDGVADNSDKFPLNRRESRDMDNDGIGDNSDTDNDNDGFSDDKDEFPYDNSEHCDTDADRLGDNADDDDDNDGVPDGEDPAPKDPNIPNRYQPQTPNRDAVIIDDSDSNPEQNSNHGVSW